MFDLWQPWICEKLATCRFKDGERRVYDTERELGAKVQHGVQEAGNVAEHDYDRYDYGHDYRHDYNRYPPICCG